MPRFLEELQKVELVYAFAVAHLHKPSNGVLYHVINDLSQFECGYSAPNGRLIAQTLLFLVHEPMEQALAIGFKFGAHNRCTQRKVMVVHNLAQGLAAPISVVGIFKVVLGVVAFFTREHTICADVYQLSPHFVGQCF